MNPILISILILVLGLAAEALELEFQHESTLPHKMKFKESSIGGLSGIVASSEPDHYFVVSDDRGNINEPRFYDFKISVSGKELRVEPERMIFLSVNESNLSHSTTKSSSKLFSKVLDLEGISLTPWGDLLLINEGDMNKKPRVPPQLFSIQADGTIQKAFEVPPELKPEASGPQKKGVRNNLSFEGLARNPNGQEWMVAVEGPLLQDEKNFIRLIQYNMPEAWVLRPQKEFRYPIQFGSGGAEREPGSEKKDSSRSYEIQKGVAEVTYLDENRLLVLERSLLISSEGLKFQVQIFETDLKAAGKDKRLSKKLVLDLSSLRSKTGKTENFEGMTLGPKLANGRRSLLLVSDDNFVRDQRTQFLLFSIKE